MELSIVIPTLNRFEFLKRTLQSIADQQHADPSLYEVIVIDNGSSDDTVGICNHFKKLLKNFIYHYDDEPGQLTGRHKGTELSNGYIISFLDDDVELNPNWINAVLQLFGNDESLEIAGGPCLPRYHVYPPSWVSYFYQPTPYGGNMCLPLSLIDIGQDKLEIDPLYVFGLNYSIRKKILFELGGFHPDCIPQHLQKYQGDGETGLSLNAGNQNIKARYAAELFLYHQVSAERLTTAYFGKWYYYNGVCQSYTDLRSQSGLYSRNQDAVTPNNSLISKVLNRTGNALKGAIKKIQDPLPASVLKLQSEFNDKYNEGYNFHQLAFKTDQSVKEWVMKKDYWDYYLPA